jgi:hypothetical protein
MNMLSMAEKSVGMMSNLISVSIRIHTALIGIPLYSLPKKETHEPLFITDQQYSDQQSAHRPEDGWKERIACWALESFPL